MPGNDVNQTQEDELLRAKLNTETARIEWRELERFYARGVVVRVAGHLDLVEAAFCMARDDSDQVKVWLTSGELRKATAADARDWQERSPVLRAVVTAPWVLVQERQDNAGGPAH